MKGESEPGQAPRAGSSSAEPQEERCSQPPQQLIAGFFSFPSLGVSYALIGAPCSACRARLLGAGRAEGGC